MNINSLQTGFASHRPLRMPGRRVVRRAAVAAVFGQHDGDLCALLIKRAQRAGDPWSGHMALPGGRLDSVDSHAEAAARRETQEETGLRLEADDCIGRLSDRLTRAHSKPVPMVVSAFAYACPQNAGEIALNHEVDAALWVPLAYLAAPEHRERMRWKIGPVRMHLPCCDYRGYRIWGLTLMLLDEVVCMIQSG